MVGAEAEVDSRQLDQAVDRQAAAGEQRQRQRELDGHERPAGAMAARSGGGTPAVLQHIADVRARGLPCRSAAE